jgi:hypothetical protein
MLTDFLEFRLVRPEGGRSLMQANQNLGVIEGIPNSATLLKLFR